MILHSVAEAIKTVTVHKNLLKFFPQIGSDLDEEFQDKSHKQWGRSNNNCNIGSALGIRQLDMMSQGLPRTIAHMK